MPKQERIEYIDPDLPKFERFHRGSNYDSFKSGRGKKPVYKDKRFGKKNKYDFDEA